MLEEFLKWDSPGGFLWQLVDGVPVAMSPPVPPHGAIQSEMSRLIGNHLLERDAPCTVVTTPGVIPRVQADRNFLVPDLAVTCSSTDVNGKALHEPVLYQASETLTHVMARLDRAIARRKLCVC